MAGKKPSSHFPAARQAALADLVAYQADAIVSRPLIQRETGSATLFAFAAGQALSEHTAPFDALVYVVDGSAEITIVGKAYNLCAGETIILPARRPHAVKAVRQFKMLLVMIRSNL